jgi:hypothetical protein
MKTVLAIKSILGRRANIHIIHLYRDPRGFYCSEKKSDVGMTIERSAKRWLSYHRRVTRIVKPLCKARYLAVRYEDLCDHPEATMQKVFAFIGVEYEDVFHPSGEHHLLGNSSMERFDGTMRKSEKWREELTPDSQAAILSATNPLAQQMGYRDDQYERNMDRGLRSGGD